MPVLSYLNYNIRPIYSLSNRVLLFQHDIHQNLEHLLHTRNCNINHRLLFHRIKNFLEDEFAEKKTKDYEEYITTLHNYIDLDNMIVRKGAISAQKGEKVLIPFNMRDGIAICVGKGNEDYNYSAPHGAGRLMSRSQAKKNLNLEKVKEDMKKAGVYTTSLDYALDEAPDAYKDKEEIIQFIEPTVEVIETIKPVFNIKGK